jgi:serine phosphatase RsbU (regulator of sigma subunit)
VIFIYDARVGALVPRSVHRPAGSLEQATVSQSILQQSIEERVGILMGDASRDERFQDADSVVGSRIESALCVPLISKDEVHGAIYLDLRDQGRSYAESDLQWLVGVSAQAGLAIKVSLLHNESLEKRQRERDLEIARSIQMNLLPRSMPSIPGFDFSGMSRPALMVGGDYYDVAPLGEDSVVLAIADVSGKGIPAAILVASVRSAVRIEARSLSFEDIVTVVTRLNESVCDETMSNMFVTMVLAVLDASTRRLTFCNAGHSHPILRTPEGTITQLQAGGCFLGIDPDMKIEAETVALPPGSLLVFYTDGVTDALNVEGEPYGLERLIEYIEAHHAEAAEVFVEGLDAAVREYQGDAESFDDFTVLVVRAEEASG